MDQINYWETSKYRCLNEHFPPQSDSLYLTLCGVENCTADKRIAPRKRDGYHLHVILSGEGELHIGKTRIPLHGGQMFLVKPDEPIGYAPNPKNPWTYCWMSFDGANAARYMNEAGFDKGVNSLNCYLDVQRFYELCESALTKPQLTTFGALHRFGLLSQYVALAIESYEKGRKKRDEALRLPMYLKEGHIEHALDFIKNNYSSISVADISSYLGIDRSYFAVLFKQSQGVSAREYLLYVRMRKSSHMLTGTTMSVQEIARFVGYENALTFSKTFKRFFGVSPKYYREMPVEERPSATAILETMKSGQCPPPSPKNASNRQI